MKLVRGIWLPDTDEHFALMMSRAPEALRGGSMVGTYQKHKLDAALAITENRRIAVDVGAHVGFWSMWLGDAFQHVHAFEPVREHAACFRRNVTCGNVTLHECALGAAAGSVGMATDPENSGKARVRGGGSTPLLALDELALNNVDLIKIDVEGMEADVIAGAAATIARCKPVMVIEQNGPTTDVETLVNMGMRVYMRITHDWILRW